MRRTISSPEHGTMIEIAEKAISHAQDVRAYHRKRTRVGHIQRKTDVTHANLRLRFAMRPIRSALGKAPYRPINETSRRENAELKVISQRLQTERRKLWKLNGGARRRKRRT